MLQLRNLNDVLASFNLHSARREILEKQRLTYTDPLIPR